MRFAARALLLTVLGSAFTACTRQASSEVVPAVSSATASPFQLAAATTTLPLDEDEAETPQEEPSFAEAVRMEKWDEAARLLDALPAEERNEPTRRLVRARVAIARDEAAVAVSLLEGLEATLPELRETIERWRLEAESVAGPHAEAARALEKGGSLKALGLAAAAYERAELFEDAKRVAGRVVAKKKGGEDEILARSVRARIAEALGDASSAVVDARWLAIEAPKAGGASWMEVLERLDPKGSLTARERIARAQNLAAAFEVDSALAELDEVAKMKDAPAREDLAFTRGMILYRARRYMPAALAFDKAKTRGKQQAQASFLAARARSRADHDTEAARGYRDVIKRFPKTSQADEASYLLARLAYLHGNWKEAITGFDGYLKSYPRGSSRGSAQYERAVSLLAARKWTLAERELALLVRKEKGQEAARLKALQAKAMAEAGNREGAVKLLTEVATSQPLLFPGQVARARLQRLGAALPPLIAAAKESEDAEATPIALPKVAKLYRSLGLDGEAEAWLRERESSLAKGPSRGKALCEMYGELGRATRRYRLGIALVPESLLMRAPSKETQWAWECVYPRPYAKTVEEVEAREKLPRGLVHAVMRVESAYDPEAVSRASARGLLQLMPNTARNVASEHELPFEDAWLTSPPVNIDLGGRYLAKMRDTFDGSIPLMAAGYNAGPHATARWLSRSQGLDLDVFVARIPYRETRNYVQRVVSNWARYAYLEGGEEAVPALTLELPKPIKLGADSY